MKYYATAALLANMLNLPLCASAQERQLDRLHAYTECQFEDGLQIVDTARFSEHTHWRAVQTGAGAYAVSIADGYRLLLAYPDTDIFANLKVETSLPGYFEQDRNIIVSGMEFIAARARGVTTRLHPLQFGNVYGYMLNNPDLSGGSLSLVTLFHPQRSLTLTAYFFNQKPERRKFQSIQEFRELQTRFLNRYLACLEAAVR